MIRKLATPRMWPFLGLLVALVLVGAAAGFFTSAGSGRGSAPVGSDLALAIAPATATPQLYPGGSGDVLATISNSNPFAVRVASLALDTSQASGGIAVDAAHSACATSALSYTTQTNGGLGWTIPARVGASNGTLDVRLAAAISMSTTAASECQDAVFTVYLKAGS